LPGLCRGQALAFKTGNAENTMVPPLYIAQHTYRARLG
jgi:hypothetical protein